MLLCTKQSRTALVDHRSKGNLHTVRKQNQLPSIKVRRYSSYLCLDIYSYVGDCRIKTLHMEAIDSDPVAIPHSCMNLT